MGLSNKQLKDYKFPSSPQMQNLLKFVANTHGCFSRDQFKKAGGSSQTERYWKKAGLIERNPHDANVFFLTPKFAREYQKQIDPSKGITRSGITAPKHSEGVNRVLEQLPADIQMKDIYNETDVKREMKVPTPEMQQRIHELKDDIFNRQCQLQDEYNKASHEEQTRLYYDLTAADKLQAMSEKDIVYRTPDMAVTFTPEQLQQYRDATQEHFDSLGLRGGSFKMYYQESIQKMDRLILEAVRTHTEAITIAIEIVTHTYDSAEMELHTNYETITDTEQIMIPCI